jgi:flavin-dependent dehydrogenase
MVAMAGQLEDPGIVRCLADAQPAGKLTLYRRPASVWRRYDLMQPQVPGYLPMGDALAVVNPLGGQGISVAAWEAVLLDDVVSRVAGHGITAEEVTTGYLSAATEAVGAAWQLGEWMLDPSGDENPKHAHTAMAAIASRVRDDVDFHRYYARVWHLLEPLAPLQDYVTSVLTKAETPHAD